MFIPVKGGYHNNNHHFQLTLNSKAQKAKNSVLSENENNWKPNFLSAWLKNSKPL